MIISERDGTMLTQMHKEAFDALIRELGKVDLSIFATNTINRLKNEDPLYAFLVEYLAGKYKIDCGSEGLAIALEMGAICHRARELAEQYKNSTTQYQTIVDDPIPSLEAVEEAKDLVSIIMMSSRKNSKK